MERIILNDLIININKINNDEYNLIITNNNDIYHNYRLSMNNPSIGNIDDNNLFINVVRFARDFNNNDIFFAEIIYNDKKFKDELFEF
jgi:hypothetical protein